MAQWQGELRLAFIDHDRVTFYLHVDEPPMELQRGRRFMCVLVEIADDEKPDRGERTAVIGKVMSPSNHCAILCKDEDFQKWSREQLEQSSWVQTEPSEENAIKLVKTICGIESRAELDTDPEALARYQTLIEIPYYRQRTGETHGSKEQSRGPS